MDYKDIIGLEEKLGQIRNNIEDLTLELKRLNDLMAIKIIGPEESFTNSKKRLESYKKTWEYKNEQ